MANNNAQKNYINGIFLRKVWQAPDGSGGELISIGIKKDDVLAQLNALQADDRGFINLTAGTQRDDKTKYSVWEKEERAQQPAPRRAPSYSPGKSAAPRGYSPKPAIPSSANVDDSPLPF